MSKFAQYSLLLIAYLAKNYSLKYISLNDIAREHNISFAFLKQVALNLKKHDLIDSMEGINGGYKLKNKPSKTTLDQVIKAIQEEKTPYICKDHKNCTLNCFCAIKFAWDNAQAETLTKLSRYKLSDFLMK
ncbi:MAG: Rrf2 family transcriptional regulator [Patescibacteria group bacterium]|jgi:Rrf2 family nitric oxide-sensitive transcriptional repressor